MTKIGIITIPDYNNYGNRLQNYAVKCYFMERGFCADTLELNDEAYDMKKKRKYKLLLKKYRLFFVNFAFEFLKEGFPKAKRYMCFERFSQRYLSPVYSPNWESKYNEQIGKKYKYIVLGSDQIWHPYVNATPNLFFGLFVPPEKRLFFSPSFGLDSITDEYSNVVKNGLEGVKKVSIREIAGKDILKKCIDIDAKVLCDPTLVISKQQWSRIAKSPKGIPNEYVLSYFLGPVNNDYSDLLKKVEKVVGKGIYSIADKSNKDAYATGPSEFIYSIMNTEFVVTDSFHAVVFSIIFSKPFIVCSRLKEDGTYAGLDSRIDILLERFNLKDRKYQGSNDIMTIYNEIKDRADVLDELRKEVDSYFNDIC